jgi:hypothetical protein
MTAADRRNPAPHASLDFVRRRRRARQGGFNFCEVLFAVMILGIGFIMIAAIFPVALQQTKQTGEEVIAGSSSRGGVNFMRQVGAVSGALPVSYSRQMIPAAGAGGPTTITLPGAVYSFFDDRIWQGPDNVPQIPSGTPANDPDMTKNNDGPLTAAATRFRMWNEIAGKLILPSDNRLAWVAFYRRGATFTNSDTAAHEQDYIKPPAGGFPPTSAPPNPLPPNPLLVRPQPYAQVIVIAVEVRNRSNYDAVKDLGHYNPNAPATLEPRKVYVKLAEGNTNADQLQFFDGDTPGAAAIDEPAAAEGAFVIISDDQLIDNPATASIFESNGMLNGHIYRLGTQRIDLGPGRYELASGWDMEYRPSDGYNENIPARNVSTPTNPAVPGAPAIAFIVGRGYTDPTSPYVNTGTPGAGFEGPVQDVAVYTSLVPAN